jgi:nucleoside-diphosphate kinase
MVQKHNDLAAALRPRKGGLRATLASQAVRRPIGRPLWETAERRYKAARRRNLDSVKESRMAIERTLSIIKPDATARNLTGAINALIERAGLRIVAQKRVRWSKAQAEKFYEVHKARPFYGDLVAFMTSAPIVVQVLEGENAVKAYRDVMGATDPAKAAAGTIRKEFAENIERNSVHGSDSVENAATEIALNFRPDEIIG